MKVLNLSREQLSSSLNTQWQPSEYGVVTISAVLLRVPGVEFTFPRAARVLLPFVRATRTAGVPHRGYRTGGTAVVVPHRGYRSDGTAVVVLQQGYCSRGTAAGVPQRWYRSGVGAVAEQCLHSPGACSASVPRTHTAGRLGWAAGWEGTKPAQLTQTDAPYYMMSRSAIKTQGKQEERGMFVVMAFVFPSN